MSVSPDVVSVSNLEVVGGSTFSHGKIVFSDDGTINVASIQINPDGSMQLGLSVAVSSDGTLTVNGASLVSLNDFVFKKVGVGPILRSDDGNSFFRLRVRDDGTVYTEPA